MVAGRKRDRLGGIVGDKYHRGKSETSPMYSALGGVTGLQQLVAAAGGLVPRGSRELVFNTIFEVFLALGTLVGIVVVGYMMWNLYKYRDHDDRDDHPDDAPQLGEIPQGGGGGRKLFLSFALSAIIVVTLITWTYFTLLYVEGGAAAQSEDALTIEVEGYQFGWQFTYPNGTTTGTLRVPEDRPVRIVVTSRDVFHNFGIPAFHVKADAIPGQTTDTWFIPDEEGEYLAKCYELCGEGHSYMTAQVIVMSPDEYQNWYESTNGTAKLTTPTSTPA